MALQALVNLGKAWYNEKGKALVTVSSLAGTVYMELQFDIGRSIDDLKGTILGEVRPNAKRDDVEVTLFIDGNLTNDEQTLADIGVDVSDHVHFTALIYDPYALGLMEINRMHADAIARSHQEAVAARIEQQERRKQLIAQRKQEAESEYLAQCGGPQVPLLMLAAEPANQSHCNQAAIPDASLTSDQQLVAQRDQSMSKPETTGVAIGLGAEHTPSGAEPDRYRQIMAVIAAYESFFDHISFRKGWKQPPFSLEEAAKSFNMAAFITVRIRIEVLDVRDSGFKLRQVEGSARDWMHSSECAALLRSRPSLFMAGLVHATFKDANGYVEGLQESEVNSLIQLYSREAMA